MVINLKTKNYEMQSTQPNINYYPNDSDIVLLKEFEEDSEGNVLKDKPNPLANIVIDSWLEHQQGCFDIEHENGIVTDIIPTEPIPQEIAESQLSQEEIIAEIKRLAALLP